jgi:hypothetical protein
MLRVTFQTSQSTVAGAQSEDRRTELMDSARSLLNLRDELATVDCELGDRRMAMARRYLGDQEPDRFPVPRSEFDSWFGEDGGDAR